MKKLEARGSLTRVRSDEDGRRVDVALTAEGQAMKEAARKVPLAMGQCIDIGPEDAAELVRILRKMLLAMND